MFGRCFRHADADGKVDLAVDRVDGAQQRGVYTLDNRRNVVPGADPFQEHDELIATVANDVISASYALAKSPCHLVQDTVADNLAVRVVYFFEIVQINKQHCELPVGRPVSVQQRLEPLE